MSAVHLFQRIGDLADRGLRPSGADGQCQQVVTQSVRSDSFPGRGGPGKFGQRRIHRRVIAICTQLPQFGQLLGTHPAVLDLEHLDVGVLVDLVLVNPDHRLRTGVDSRLGPGRGFLDPQFGDALSDGLGHPATFTDLGDVGSGPLCEFVSQPLQIVGTGPRVDRAGGAGFLLQQQLGVARDARGEVCGQRQSLVEGIGVQRLGVPLGRGHCLDTGAGDVVERILCGQRPSGGLRMRPQRQRFRVLRTKPGDQLAPQQPPRAEFGDLHEEVHPDAPEE